jgi:alkanesulfonate monooxygenase SsuD/methylene tetrahydromethanopterin reductase-like flavin-dependent oxidoreductase (luciferase family)
VLAELRDAMTRQVDNARLEAGETVDDWTIIGEPEYVHERIEAYRHRLGMTHLIATRLRIGGVPETALRASVASLAELVDGF